MENKNYLVYKIINKINGKIYIGAHITENIDDGYMGSGTALRLAQKKYGIKNFEKIILYNLPNKEEMLNKELELVNKEFVKRDDTYNLVTGGTFNPLGLVNVKDINGNIISVSVTDPRYLSGELVHCSTGLAIVKDQNGKIFKVDKNDPRLLCGELTGITKGKIIVKDQNGKTFFISKDSSEYLDYLNGILTFIWSGRKMSEEHRRKIGEKSKTTQKGEKNSQFGTCWIYNKQSKENKKINKNDLTTYLNMGWIKGRKIKK